MTYQGAVQIYLYIIQGLCYLYEILKKKQGLVEL